MHYVMMYVFVGREHMAQFVFKFYKVPVICATIQAVSHCRSFLVDLVIRDLSMFSIGNLPACGYSFTITVVCVIVQDVKELDCDTEMHWTVMSRKS